MSNVNANVIQMNLGGKTKPLDLPTTERQAEIRAYAATREVLARFTVRVRLLATMCPLP